MYIYIHHIFGDMLVCYKMFCISAVYSKIFTNELFYRKYQCNKHSAYFEKTSGLQTQIGLQTADFKLSCRGAKC